MLLQKGYGCRCATPVKTRTARAGEPVTAGPAAGLYANSVNADQCGNVPLATTTEAAGPPGQATVPTLMSA